MVHKIIQCEGRVAGPMLIGTLTRETSRREERWLRPAKLGVSSLYNKLTLHSLGE